MQIEKCQIANCRARCSTREARLLNWRGKVLNSRARTDCAQPPPDGAAGRDADRCGQSRGSNCPQSDLTQVGVAKSFGTEAQGMRTVRTVVSPLLPKCVPEPLFDASSLLNRIATPALNSFFQFLLAVRVVRTLPALVRTLADAGGMSDVKTQSQRLQFVATCADAADAADAVFPNFPGGEGAVGRGQNAKCKMQIVGASREWAGGRQG
jgi:hypothetical protein